MNSINFTGNLGGDAEQKILADGTSIVSMNVPCKSGFGDKAITTWLRCSLFGNRGASLMPHLTKGTLVGITGEFSAREYNDRDGNKKQSLEVRVSDVSLLGSRKDAPAAAPRPAAKPAPKAAPSGGFDDLDSDVPF
jgi:single-strand DNA-binding protein